MHIALIYDAKLPVHAYGGTERVIWWLAQGLSELGHQVSLVVRTGSSCPFANVIEHDFSKPIATDKIKADLFHFFTTPNPIPSQKYVVTIEGNGKLNERFLPNTIFASKNHAKRHNATCFVHNGINPDDYQFSKNKKHQLAFLAKASWLVKNVKGAVRIAKKAKYPLYIMGGSKKRFWPTPNQHWLGMVGGEQKNQVLANSSALLFPIIWNEPFGVAVTEALVSGTPVIATNRGAMAEIITDEVGALCESEFDFLQAIEKLGDWNSEACRDWAVEKFHYLKMAEKYLTYYEQILMGKDLHQQPPQALGMPQQLLPIQ